MVDLIKNLFKKTPSRACLFICLDNTLYIKKVKKKPRRNAEALIYSKELKLSDSIPFYAQHAEQEE